jgi:hypothetical protein
MPELANATTVATYLQRFYLNADGSLISAEQAANLVRDNAATVTHAERMYSYAYWAADQIAEVEGLMDTELA